jgi:hypothetical protein
MISMEHQSRGYGWPSHSVRRGLYMPGECPVAAPPAWAGNSHLSFRRSGWLRQLPVSDPKTRPNAMLFRPQWDPPRTETAASLRDEKCSDLSVARSPPSRRKSPHFSRCSRQQATGNMRPILTGACCQCCGYQFQEIGFSQKVSGSRPRFVFDTTNDRRVPPFCNGHSSRF